MSARISGRVWDLDLPHAEQFVLLAMADHADHEGRNVRPSVGLVAWKTNYSPRQVHRIIQRLREKGILVPDGAGRNGTLNYRIDLSAAPLKTPYTSRDSIRVKRDRMAHPALDKMAHPASPDDVRDVTGGVTPGSHREYDSALSYDPSLTSRNPQVEEESPLRVTTTGASTVVTQDAHTEAVATLRAEGIVTLDGLKDIPINVIRAAVASTGLPPGHVARPGWIVKRLRLWREGKWTPPATIPVAATPASHAPAPALPQTGVWAEVLSQLATMVPQSEFATWLAATVLLDLDRERAVVGCQLVFIRDHLATHYADQLAAVLQTVLGRAVGIEFTVGELEA